MSKFIVLEGPEGVGKTTHCQDAGSVVAGTDGRTRDPLQGPRNNYVGRDDQG